MNIYNIYNILYYIYIIYYIIYIFPHTSISALQIWHCQGQFRTVSISIFLLCIQKFTTCGIKLDSVYKAVAGGKDKYLMCCPVWMAREIESSFTCCVTENSDVYFHLRLSVYSNITLKHYGYTHTALKCFMFVCGSKQYYFCLHKGNIDIS